MSKHAQKSGGKGSLNQIQLWVNNDPNTLNQSIENAIPALAGDPINWHSPLQSHSYSEYRDGDFLDLLGLSMYKSALQSFWPKGGPQWDALAKTKSGKIILVEAKGNETELRSSCQAKAASSISRIESSLDATKRHYGINPNKDWMIGFYQYANRLAHLYFLSELCKVETYLVFIHFLDDKSVNGPQTEAEWQKALHPMYAQLGLANNWPQNPVANIFIKAK